MKKLFFIALIIIISAKNFAQQRTETPGNDTNIFNDPRSGVISSFNKNLKGTVGTPYIEDFSLARIPGYNQNYLIRYDAYKDQMQAKNPENQIIILNKDNISEVIFSNQSKYKIFNYTLDKLKKKGYLKVLYEGEKITLLKKETVKFYPAREATSSYQQDKKASYKRASDIYFVLNNVTGEINSFYKKKDFIKLFPEKKKDIESLIKSNKIKFNKEKSLTELITNLNTLI